MAKWTKEEIDEYNKTHNFQHYAVNKKHWRNTDRHCVNCGLNCPCAIDWPDQYRRTPSGKVMPSLMDWDQAGLYHQYICPDKYTAEEIQANRDKFNHNNHHYQKIAIEFLDLNGKKPSREQVKEEMARREIPYYEWSDFSKKSFEKLQKEMSDQPGEKQVTIQRDELRAWMIDIERMQGNLNLIKLGIIRALRKDQPEEYDPHDPVD